MNKIIFWELKMPKTITLTDNQTGETHEFPILEGSQGPNLIDIRTLYSKTGYFTFDPGYGQTGACESNITFIDGDKGVLQHGGYSIEDLAGKSTFLEVCYLLLNGELPKQAEYDAFHKDIIKSRFLNEQISFFFRGFRRDAHPMAMLVGVVGALSSFYHDGLDAQSPESRVLASHRMIAKLPTIVAMAYKYSMGQAFLYPHEEYSYTDNFLYMTFGKPNHQLNLLPEVVNALDKIFILHADHEQNASTSTVRMSGSTGANPYAALSAGISALWGPAHGGANEEVLNMLKSMGSVNDIPQYIKRAKDKNDPFRLMGFGHRVYKNFDPRANVLRESCHEVLDALGMKEQPLLKLALELERIALEDEYFIERKLFPNVDFYSGIILEAIGFPSYMFTPLFALARTAGWVSQWKEMNEDKSSRLCRPRQLYLGETKRDYVPINKR